MRHLVAAILSSLLRTLRRRHFPLNAREWHEVRMSFSQLGEDRLIWHFLREHRNERGIYVDVGAFDPVRYSNTLLLHKEGWKGINIDPNPEVAVAFAAARPNDVSLCAAVSNSERPVEYIVYPSRATNRIVDPGSADLLSVLGEQPLQRIPMRTRTLNAILSESARRGEAIDLLNVDCEGEDLSVLEGLDWEVWRPRIVCVEAHGADNQERITQFMRARNYRLTAQILVSFLFLRTEDLDS